MKGRVLGGQIREISAEFEAYFHGFASKSYDVLDPDDETFNTDFKDFQENIIDLDLKLSTVLVESFDNCSTLESIFKVHNSFIIDANLCLCVCLLLKYVTTQSILMFGVRDCMTLEIT